jgi:hypothetical protein
MRILGSIAAAIVFVIAATGTGRADPTSILVPKFVEETATAGIDGVYAGDWQYMVGGGAASFDCDDDGFPDLYLAGGEGKASFFRNVGVKGGPLKFVREQSGLEFDAVTGAYPLDVDGDGKTDLIVLRVGENVAMRGLGGCKFERANEAWGFEGGDAWSTSLGATWEHGATWPTVAIGNYIDRNEDISPWGSCTDNWLQRQSVVDGQPRSRFAPPLALKPSFCPLSMLFTDWDRSGTPSLRMSNDREYYEGGQEQMWKVPPGGAPSLYTAEEGWKYLRIWGMGIAAYDLNFDGYPEYFLTSMADNKLQTLAAVPTDGKPQPSYADVAYAKGATAHRPYMGDDLKPSTGWHTQFEDVNNDGLADLFIAKGNVGEMPDFTVHDPNNLLVQQSDGKFQETGDRAGIASMENSRGAALADFNLDGLVDLVVVNRWHSAQVWRNETPQAGHWVQVKLDQPGANHDGIGAWIEVRCDGVTLRREITVGGGHAGGSLGWHHFGVGGETKVDLRVTWPDGKAGDWQSVDVDGFYVLPREGAVRPWTPAR